MPRNDGRGRSGHGCQFGGLPRIAGQGGAPFLSCARLVIGQRDPYGKHETSAIFQISTARVTTYAVLPINPSEVG